MWEDERYCKGLETTTELQTRGGQINANNFDGMRETENRITNLISKEHEKLTRPTAAFITFENDLGKMLAAPADDTVRQAKNDKRKLLDVRCDF